MSLDILRLFRILPATLRLAWGLILAGFLALTAGYFTGSGWQGTGGAVCLLAGYAVVIIDMINPRRGRGSEARAAFYSGIVGATLAAMLGAVILAFLSALALAIVWLLDRSAPPPVLRALHLLGIVFAAVLVTGIPSVACRLRRTDRGDRADPDEPG